VNRKKVLGGAGAAVAVAATVGIVLATTGPSGAAQSIVASKTNPVYWQCQNKSTGALTGLRTYDGTNTYPVCGSAYNKIWWHQNSEPGATGPAGSVFVGSADSLDNGQVVLTNIGGKIADGITPLTEDLTLPAGTYQLTAYGDFSRKAGTGGDNPTGNQTYGSLSIWVDVNNDGHYDWQTGEDGGTVQTGALPITPTGSIEQAATEQQILTVPAGQTYHVRLGGFGYNSNTGSYGTVGQPGAGDFSVLGAKLDAVQLATK
jgi:hypothetical protein